jgi:hypothetical protein
MKLVSIAAGDTSGRKFIALDEDGRVLGGDMKRGRDGGEYIEWTRIPSELPRD